MDTADTPARASLPANVDPGAGRALADRLRAHTEQVLDDFPWEVRFSDWAGRSWRVGGDAPHWRGLPLEVGLRTQAAARALLTGNGMGFLEKVLAGEADLEGNLYLLPQIRAHAHLRLGWLDTLRFALQHRAFQSPRRAQQSVRSHYDIPQSAIDRYLDRIYRAYSCAMFTDPGRMELGELLRPGEGEEDTFDSLEQAQWRKFADAVDFVAPEAGDTLLDIGCGYGGQLRVALERQPLRKVVGWTHSTNQAREGAKLLADFDSSRWELREGDYRQDDAVYDHVTSTGMVSHVGPRGLVPYVRNVRRRIKTGGRYLHHCLMKSPSTGPLDFQIGPVFHKRFVWPGFHWFTLGEHVRALERNGFEVQGMRNLQQHYSKTAAAWYERLMAERDPLREILGEPTFRAWRIFLAGASGDIGARGIHIYRVYCKAV